MKTSLFKSLSFTLGLLAGLSTPLLGFRPIENEGRDVVRAFEETFLVNSHLELYRIYVFEASGEVKLGWMYLIYEYKDDKVYGLWRILEESEDLTPATLLNIQPYERPGDLFLYDRKLGNLGKLSARERRGYLSDTDWHLEDIQDNDKAGMDFFRDGAVVLEGTYATKITSRYKNPSDQRLSVYGQAIYYFSAPGNDFLKLELHDQGGNFLKSIRAANYFDHGTEEHPLSRPARIEIVNQQRGSMTICVKHSAAFNLELPEDIFTTRRAKNWSKTDDDALKALLKPFKEARSS